MSAVPVHHVRDRGTIGRRVAPKMTGALWGCPPLEGVGRDAQRLERRGRLPPPSFVVPVQGAIVHFSRVGIDFDLARDADGNPEGHSGDDAPAFLKGAGGQWKIQNGRITIGTGDFRQIQKMRTMGIRSEKNTYEIP